MKPVYLIDQLYDLKPKANVHDETRGYYLTGRLIVETAALAMILVVIGILVMA